ncbi:MAG: hypothetical protein DRJ55_04850 [Thermoprotei archaeon]|nr:MAG: hypothetical protein DRJ55_04850 [Thermoprotei archaeon]
MIKMSAAVRARFALAFILALVNDILDIVGFFSSPVIESAADILLAAALLFLLGLSPVPIAVAILDAFPGIDLSPAWTAYVAYKYLTKKTARKVKVE